MIIASYRNTERGIQSARQRPVATLVTLPVFRPDNSLLPIMAVKFDDYMGAAHAELRKRGERLLPRKYRYRFDAIIKRFCRVFKVTWNDIRSERRDYATVYARQAIYYWAWRMTSLSSVQIGQRLGGRSHGTVLVGISAYRHKRAKMGRYLHNLRRAAL